jgi:hypothetical protein
MKRLPSLNRPGTTHIPYILSQHAVWGSIQVVIAVISVYNIIEHLLNGTVVSVLMIYVKFVIIKVTFRLLKMA